MRSVLLFGSLIVWSLSVDAQTASVPTVILDSLIFEVKLGRQCSEVIKAQSVELEKQGLELVATGKALELSQSSNSTLSALLANARDYSGILTQQFTLDKNKLKAKIKRLWFWVVSEGVVIIVIVLLI